MDKYSKIELGVFLFFIGVPLLSCAVEAAPWIRDVIRFLWDLSCVFRVAMITAVVGVTAGLALYAIRKVATEVSRLAPP